MKRERCILCDDLTGRAGRSDDSIFIDVDGVYTGPLCERCRDEIVNQNETEVQP